MNIAGNFQIKLSRNIDSLLRLYPWFKKGYPLCSIRGNGEIHIPAEIRPTLILPQRIIFRSGALEKIGREIKSSSMFTKKGLLVTGKAAMKKLGITQKIIARLKEERVEIALFDQIEPDPDVTAVEQGVKISTESMVTSFGFHFSIE